MAYNISTGGQISSPTGAGPSSSTRFEHPPAARPPSGLIPCAMPSSRSSTTIGQVRPTTADYGNDDAPNMSGASRAPDSIERPRDRLYASPRRKRQRIDADRYVWPCRLLRCSDANPSHQIYPRPVWPRFAVGIPLDPAAPAPDSGEGQAEESAEGIPLTEE